MDEEQPPGPFDAARFAFREFLGIPSAIVAAFLVLAAVTQVLDRSSAGPSGPLRDAMQRYVFSDPQATGDLLGTVAGSVITVTSITVSLVLLAVQQAAGSLTFAVIDQFLRRRLNQMTFGFFVGLALYTLLILSTVGAGENPVYGATFALLLTAVALYLLLLLLYTTINQMRPIEIIGAIHDHVLAARGSELDLIQRTMREPSGVGRVTAPVVARRSGYVTAIDLQSLQRGIEETAGGVEVVFLVSLGSFVAFRQPVAELRSESAEGLEALTEVVERSLSLGVQRDLERDAGYGIEEIVTIAWTSVSTSKSNPGPGLVAIRSLRDLLGHWIPEDGTPDPSEPPLPVVYVDRVLSELFDAFETLAVTSSESMQHQVYAEVANTFALTLGEVPAEWQERIEDVVRRILPALGDHVLTASLDEALTALREALEREGRLETAFTLAAARDRLALTIGHLNSRSTRVSGG